MTRQTDSPKQTRVEATFEDTPWQRDLHSTTPNDKRAALTAMSQSRDKQGSTVSKADELEFDRAFDRLPAYVKRNIRQMAIEEESRKSKHQTTATQRAGSEPPRNGQRESSYDLDFERLPKYVKNNIRKMAREEQQQKQAKASFDDLDFDRLPKYVQKNIRRMAREEQQQKLALEQNKQQSNSDTKHVDSQPDSDPFGASYDRPFNTPVKMTYDKAMNAYITDDGYILSLPKTKPDRASGIDLAVELDKLAIAEERAGYHNRTRPATRDKDGYIVSLPDSKVSYKQLARSVPVAELYGPGGIQCADKAYTAGISIWPFSRMGILKTVENDECRLAQTVNQACALPELIALDAGKSHSISEQRRKSQAVVTAAKFCAETINATKREQERIHKDANDT